MTPLRLSKRIDELCGEIDISLSEFLVDILRLYGDNDVAGMKKLYTLWENLQVKPSELNPDSILHSKSLLDSICRVADSYTTTPDLADSVMRAEWPDLFVGKVRQFYRNAVDYHPVSPHSN